MTRPPRHLRLVVPRSGDYQFETCAHVMSCDGVVLITISGEIDVQTAPHISEAVDAALERQPSSIFIDLAPVSFFGVAGATALLGARQKCRRNGVNFALLRPSPSTRLVLALTGLLSPKGLVAEPTKPKGSAKTSLRLVGNDQPSVSFGGESTGKSTGKCSSTGRPQKRVWRPRVVRI